MPRLFTGLELPPDIAFELDMMKGGIEGARWIDRENYHVTLRFVGDVPDRVAHELDGELSHIAAVPEFSLKLSGMGMFGSKKPHALYARIEENADLRRLQQVHERVCQSLGLPPEPRKFVPHVTLARLKGADRSQTETYISSHNLYGSRTFEVGQFVLFSSRASRGGGPYGREEVYPLAAAV